MWSAMTLPSAQFDHLFTLSKDHIFSIAAIHGAVYTKIYYMLFYLFIYLLALVT